MFDFKTLDTKIPHDKLKENFKIFISSMFNFKNKRYINIGDNSAPINRINMEVFHEKDFINHTEYLIDNCYTAFDNKVVKQVMGVPMSTNCASHVANIFLHVYEK